MRPRAASRAFTVRYRLTCQIDAVANDRSYPGEQASPYDLHRLADYYRDAA